MSNETARWRVGNVDHFVCEVSREEWFNASCNGQNVSNIVMF
jgi:hypothetical protein